VVRAGLSVRWTGLPMRRTYLTSAFWSGRKLIRDPQSPWYSITKPGVDPIEQGQAQTEAPKIFAQKLDDFRVETGKKARHMGSHDDIASVNKSGARLSSIRVASIRGPP
jgi:hypothetical protein